MHSPEKLPHGSRTDACLVRTPRATSARCYLQPRSVQKPPLKSIPTSNNSSASDPWGPVNTLCRCWSGGAQPQTARRAPVNATTASCETDRPRNQHYSRRQCIVAAVEKAQLLLAHQMNVSDGRQAFLDARHLTERPRCRLALRLLRMGLLQENLLITTLAGK